MKITVKFTDVYDGDEHVRTETFDVPEPDSVDEDDLCDWALDHIFPRTGDGNAIDTDAGYFTEVVGCDDRPELVGKEFEWV